MCIEVYFIFDDIIKYWNIIYWIVFWKHTYNRTIKNRHIIGYILKIAFIIIIYFHTEKITYLCYNPFSHIKS